MHQERYPRGGIVVEKTFRRESIIQTFDLLRFEPRDNFKKISRSDLTWMPANPGLRIQESNTTSKKTCIPNNSRVAGIRQMGFSFYCME